MPSYRFQNDHNSKDWANFGFELHWLKLCQEGNDSFKHLDMLLIRANSLNYQDDES